MRARQLFGLVAALAVLVAGLTLCDAASAASSQWVRIHNVDGDTTGSVFKTYTMPSSKPLKMLYCEIIVDVVNSGGTLIVNWEVLNNSLRCGSSATEVDDACLVDSDCTGDTCDAGTGWLTIVAAASITTTTPEYILWAADATSLGDWKPAVADTKVEAPIPSNMRIRSQITGGGDFDYHMDCLEVR